MSTDFHHICGLYTLPAHFEDTPLLPIGLLSYPNFSSLQQSPTLDCIPFPVKSFDPRSAFLDSPSTFSNPYGRFSSNPQWFGNICTSMQPLSMQLASQLRWQQPLSLRIPISNPIGWRKKIGREQRRKCSRKGRSVREGIGWGAASSRSAVNRLISEGGSCLSRTFHRDRGSGCFLAWICVRSKTTSFRDGWALFTKIPLRYWKGGAEEKRGGGGTERVSKGA